MNRTAPRVAIGETLRETASPRAADRDRCFCRSNAADPANHGVQSVPASLQQYDIALARFDRGKHGFYRLTVALDQILQCGFRLRHRRSPHPVVASCC